MCNDEPRFHLERGVERQRRDFEDYRYTDHLNRYSVLKHNRKYDYAQEDPYKCDCDKCLVLFDTGLTKGYFKVKKFKHQVTVKLDLSHSKAWEAKVYKFKHPESLYDERIVKLADKLSEDPVSERWFGEAGKAGLSLTPEADTFLAAYLNFSYTFDDIRRELK